MSCMETTMSEDVPLREYMDEKFAHLGVLIDTKFDQAMEHAEFGDRQNAQAITALGSAVTANTQTIQRLEANQATIGKSLRDVESLVAPGGEQRIRALEDALLSFTAQKGLLAGFIGLAVGGGAATFISRIGG